MRKPITTAAVLAAAFLALGPVATAQTVTVPATPQTRPAPVAPEAPVGHRQPRANQVPSEKNLSNPDDPSNREDAALDRKIRSICRGC